MTILAGDIKFVKSTVMDDVPEGGGAPTGNQVVDGVSNEIFSDISELDRAGGNVSLRKVFVSVATGNTDTYLDSNIIIAEPPTDPNVSVTLFSTSATFDTRNDARQRVEAYLTESTEWPGFLLENHIEGQRILQIFQRPTESLPNIGETLVLIYNEGLGTERKQFVRVIDSSSILRTYTEANTNPVRTYEAMVVSVQISDALRVDFPGSTPTVYFTRSTSGSKIRQTSVADAAVYCGVSTTVAEVDIGDLTASVDSVFTQLVPSAQTEIPLIDVNAAGTSAALTPSGTGNVSYTTTSVIDSTTALSLGNPITPSTLSIAIGGTTLTDTGGQVFDGATAVGLVDYARGIVTFPPLTAPYSGTKTISYKVAAAPLRVADTAQIKVTPESRAFNYIVSIEPPPAPGSVLLSYRAQGRWYDLRDNGGGALRGSDSAYGVGSINYATGTIAVTLGVLPDIGSSVMFAFGTKVNYVDRSDLTVNAAQIVHTLASIPIVPNSLDIHWNDGTARTASDNGKGVITGSATGTVDYQTGEVKLNPTLLPASGLQFTYNYDEVGTTALKTKSFPSPGREVNLTVTLNLGETNVVPGTVKIAYDVDQPAQVNSVGSRNMLSYEVTPRANAHDDGNGNIIAELGRNAGTINYSTGIVNFQPDGNVLGRVSTYSAYAEFNYVQGQGAF